MASFVLYFIEFTSPIRGWEVVREGSCSCMHASSCRRQRGMAGGCNLPERHSPTAEQNMFSDSAASFIRTCKPASLTSDNKGNQTLALRRENFCNSVLCRIPIPPPRAAFSFHRCPPLVTPTCLCIPLPGHFYLHYGGQSLPLPVLL